MTKDEMAMLSIKEVMLLIATPPKECHICNIIIHNALFKNVNGDYYVMIDNLDDSDIEHLEQVVRRKITSEIPNTIPLNDSFTTKF